MIIPNRLGAWAGGATIVNTLGLLQTECAVAEEKIKKVIVIGALIKSFPKQPSGGYR